MTRRQLTLHLLREAGDLGVTTSQLLQAGCGSRYGARILELREQGFVIETERVRDGSFRYTLTFDVERDTGTPGTFEVVSGMASIPGAGVALDVDAPPSASGGETPTPARPSSGVVESHPQPLFELPEARPGFYDPDRAAA